MPITVPPSQMLDALDQAIYELELTLRCPPDRHGNPVISADTTRAIGHHLHGLRAARLLVEQTGSTIVLAAQTAVTNNSLRGHHGPTQKTGNQDRVQGRP